MPQKPKPEKSATQEAYHESSITKNNAEKLNKFKLLGEILLIISCAELLEKKRIGRTVTVSTKLRMAHHQAKFLELKTTDQVVDLLTGDDLACNMKITANA